MSAKPMLGEDDSLRRRVIAEKFYDKANPRIDIVRPLPYDYDTGRGHGPLDSGCERYADAVVVRVSPFALVSRGTDMLWSCTVERDDFRVTGQRVSFEHFERCRERITYGLTNRRVKRERANARRRLSAPPKGGE